MTRRRDLRPALLSGSLMLIGACVQQPRAPTNDTVPQLSAADLQSAEHDVDAVEAQWNADLAARDAAKVTAHYFAQGFWLSEPGLPAVHDAAGLQARFATALADPNFSLVYSPQVTGVSSSDSLAYTRGDFTETLTDPASQRKTTVRGAYVTIYVATGLHTWQASEHFASSSGSAVAPGS
jgi:ketosteroid isomerase-like protein